MSDRSEEEDGFVLIEDYQPSRPARPLREEGGEPPPLPPAGTSLAEDGFGAADEDGLLMLAALETFTSLEPDYVDAGDLAAEASVTIVEASAGDAFSDMPASGGHPWSDRRADGDAEPELLLNGYETFLALGEEATVEIVDPGRPLEDAEPPARPRSIAPTSLAERIAAAAGPGGRFFRVLSGT